MRVVSILLLALCAAPASATGSNPLDNKCVRPEAQRAEGVRSAGPRRLDQLPPANLELAVWRELAGCPQPAVLRRDVAARRR